MKKIILLNLLTSSREDQRGSIVNLLDDSADQVASYWYNDFGEVTEEKTADYSLFINEGQ